jgi:hypothetical protein
MPTTTTTTTTTSANGGTSTDTTTVTAQDPPPQQQQQQTTDPSPGPTKEASFADHWPQLPDPRDDSWCGGSPDGGSVVVDEVGTLGCGKRAILVSRPEGDIKDSDLKIVDEPSAFPKAATL